MRLPLLCREAEPRGCGGRKRPNMCPRPSQDISQVDEIIERLIHSKENRWASRRGREAIISQHDLSRRPGKAVQLAENEIRAICLMAKEICMSQPNLLELEAPIKICGQCDRGGGRGALVRAGML